MRIEILEEAENDLIDGFSFYERQAPGLEPIFSIPFLRTWNHFISMPAFMRCTSDITGCLRNASPSPFITGFETA
jgi:hypothetical protein